MLIKKIGQSMGGRPYHSRQIRHFQIRICISLLTMHDILQFPGETLAFFKTDFTGLVLFFRDSGLGLYFGNRQRLNRFL